MEDLTGMCWHGLLRSLPLAMWLIDQVLQLHILELMPVLVCFPYPSLTLWHGWHEEHLPISL